MDRKTKILATIAFFIFVPGSLLILLGGIAYGIAKVVHDHFHNVRAIDDDFDF